MMTVIDNIKQLIDHLEHEGSLDKVIRMANLRKMKIKKENRNG